MPWKLQIHCLDIDIGHATGCTGPGTSTVLGYFQPTFLYEALWDAAIGVGLLLLDRRLRLGRGNVMALYVMGYTAGRVWIEALRSDHANRILGLRLNDWTSVLVFIGGLVWFLRHGGFHAEREVTPYYDTEPAGNPPPEPEESRSPAARSRRSPKTSPRSPRSRTKSRQMAEPPGRQQARGHHQHRDVTGGWLRPTVFGMMDGLVSNFALIAGVAGASATTSQVSLAGLAGLVGGAFSMAAGEYVSVQSQNELDPGRARRRAARARVTTPRASSPS